MSRSFFVQVNARQFRGAAHGVCKSSFIFAILPKFSVIVNPVAGSSIICQIFPQTTQISLDPAKACVYNIPHRIPTCGGAENFQIDTLAHKRCGVDFSLWHFGAKTCAFLIYFAHTRKKDLTNFGLALKMAQGAHRFGTSLWHWRPRAENSIKSRA